MIVCKENFAKQKCTLMFMSSHIEYLNVLYLTGYLCENTHKVTF